MRSSQGDSVINVDETEAIEDLVTQIAELKGIINHFKQLYVSPTTFPKIQPKFKILGFSKIQQLSVSQSDILLLYVSGGKLASKATSF